MVESVKVTVATYITVHTCTVLLNYNFIFTRVDMHGATQYFARQMPKFPVEICVFTRQDMALPRDETWYLHETWDLHGNGIMTFPCDVVVLTKLNNWQDSSCL